METIVVRDHYVMMQSKTDHFAKMEEFASKSIAISIQHIHRLLNGTAKPIVNIWQTLNMIRKCAFRTVNGGHDFSSNRQNHRNLYTAESIPLNFLSIS